MRRGVGVAAARVVAAAVGLVAVAALATTVIAVLGVLDVQRRNPYRLPQTME